MWLLAIEALGAFFLFVFIVWWTMFSGKKPPNKSKTNKDQKQDQDR